MALPQKTDPRIRSCTFDREFIRKDSREVPMSISSDTPDILRYVSGKGVGYERLMHNSADNIDLSRFPSNTGGPLLLGHDRNAIIGRFFIKGVDGGKLRGYARFGNSARASEAYQDVLDGVLVDTSISYDYDESSITVAPETGRDYPTYDITHWVLNEASLVSVPADIHTGVGRAEVVVEIETKDESEDPETCTNPARTEDEPCADCIAGRKCEPRALTNGPTGPIMEVVMTDNTGSASQTTAIEVLQLRQIAENLGKGREAAEILAAKPIDEARGLINALLATTPLTSPSMGMSAPEAREYSYARAIRNAVARMEGEKVESSFEDEVASTLERALPSNYSKQGLLVPLQLRALDTATSGAAAEAVYTQYGGELIELLRNSAMTMQMGARVISGLNGPVSFPTQLTDATASWVAENPGSDMASSAPTFGHITLTPKTLAGTSAFSRSLMVQSIFSVEGVVRQSLASAHALAFDKAILHGTGSSNQPTGIYRTTGVNTVAFGGVPTYGKLQDMLTECATDNALAGNLGFITTPGVAGKMAQTLESSVAGASWLWQGQRQNGTVIGYKAASTNQVSKTMNVLVDTGASSHGLIFGNWNDVLVGMWAGLDLILDPYTLKKQQLIEVASFQMADVAVRHAASFCVGTGVAIA